MKLQRSTLVLMVLAASLVGAIYFYEASVVPSQEAAQEQEQQLFAFEEDAVQTFMVKNREQTLRFDRLTREQPEPGQPTWMLEIIEGKLPAETGESEETGEKGSTMRTMYPANEAYVSFLLNELAKGKSDRQITATAQQIQDYGLENPRARVEVTLQNGQTHRLLLGGRDFTGSNLYAQADPPDGQPTTSRPVLLVSPNLENAVDRPIEEWIQPPEEAVEGESTEGESTEGESAPETLPEPPADPSPENPEADSEAPSPEPSPTN